MNVRQQKILAKLEETKPIVKIVTVDLVVFAKKALPGQSEFQK